MTAQRGRIKTVYAVFGADAFRKREATAAICRSIAETDGGDAAPTRFDGANAELAEILDEVRTYSLLGGRRVVVVEEADAFITKHRKALERYCEAPADSGTLILVCQSLPANTRLYKIIAAGGELIPCAPLKGQAVNGWIVQRARAAYGKDLDSRTASLLRELVGESLQALDAELNKLATYVRERKQIIAADVKALVGHHREEAVFGVTDAMACGETARALAQWERVLATDRAAPDRAIGGLAWGLRRLLNVKLQAEAGASIHALARQAHAPPDVLQRRLSHVTVAGLQEQLNELLQAEVAYKTGLGNVPSAIEKFIVKHSVARKTAGAPRRPGVAPGQTTQSR